jgi:hypothetical protein
MDAFVYTPLYVFFNNYSVAALVLYVAINFINQQIQGKLKSICKYSSRSVIKYMSYIYLFYFSDEDYCRPQLGDDGEF